MFSFIEEFPMPKISGAIITLSLTLISCFFNDLAQAQDSKIQDLTAKTIILQSNKGDQQIDLGGAEKSGEITILDAPGRQGVSMQCYTTDNGHRIRIDVQNTNSTSRSCNSICYFVNSRGYSGTHNCRGTIGGNYKGLFCDAYVSNDTYRVTDPGGFDCSR
jgi:hypothetical protein